MSRKTTPKGQALTQALAGKRQRLLMTPYFEDSGLNDTEEVISGASSSTRPELPNPPATDVANLQALSRIEELEYTNIDKISKGGAALYQAPATTAPGALATIGHVSDLKPGMLVFIYQGDTWELADAYPDIFDDEGNQLPVPTVAELKTVYQCLDNETGSSPRLLSIITNAEFPLRAIMTRTQFLFIGNTDGVEQVKRLLQTVQLPLPILHIDLTAHSLAHGSRLSFAPDHENRLPIGNQAGSELPFGHVSSANCSAPSGLRLETSATDVVKQELSLVQKSSLYRRSSLEAIMGPLTDISNTEVAASIRIRMPSHLKPSLLVAMKFFKALITGKFDNLETPDVIKGCASVVGLAQALKDPAEYEHLDAPGLATAIERFFEILALVTNLDHDEEMTAEDRDFYRILPRQWIRALRGHGPESFERYDVLYVRDRLLQELMSGHRAIINTGMQRSTESLKAALTELWGTYRDFDWKEQMAAVLSWERTDRIDDRARAAKRQQIQDALTVHLTKKDSGKSSGGGGSGQPPPGASAGGGKGGGTAAATPAATTNPPTNAPPANRKPCINEILSMLKHGPQCRNTAATCAFAHYRSYGDATRASAMTKAAMKQFILQSSPVQAKKNSNPAWYQSLSAKIDTM
jgi:hypothetical protein